MWELLRRRLRYAFQFVPFTRNAIVCGLVFWAAYAILYPKIDATPQEETLDSFRPFIMLMGKVLFWFMLGLIALSFISALLTWLYYLILKNKRGVSLQLDYINKSRNPKYNKLYLQAELSKVRRPLLGFVKARLYYDDYKITDAIPLLSNETNGNWLWRKGIKGMSRMALPDIKEYEVKGGIVFFEDMLRLFSLAVPEKVGQHFYQPPVLHKNEDQQVFPKKTETLDVRIDEMRRVEGEPLNYKDFESGDDVRRIVWKVYAKNRDLVVRVPERFEPYASHLYMYASFYTGSSTKNIGDDYYREMLNYYKNAVYTIYDTLSKKDWEMRYISDQPYTAPEHVDERQKVERTISNSNWQQDNNLSKYFSARQATVLCIGSLSEYDEVEKAIETSTPGTIFYFVKLSKTFSHWLAWTWFKRLLFLPPKDRLNKLRDRWTFSPLGWQVRKRENNLLKLLAESDVTYYVV